MSSERNIFSAIAKQSSAILLVKLLGLGSGYIFFWLMGNYLGAAQTGRFSLFFTILFIASIFARAGMDTALVRWMAPMGNDPGGQKGLFLRSLLFCLGFGTLVSLLVFLLDDPIARLFSGGLKPVDVRGIALLIIPFSIIHLSFEALRALKKSLAFAFFQNVSRFFIAVLVFSAGIFLSVGTDTNDPVFAYALGVLISAVLSVVLVMIYLKPVPPKFSSVKLPEFFHTAFPMMLSASVFYLLSWTDTLMLGYFEGNTSVGIYNTTFKLATLANFPIMAVSAYVAPRLSEWFGKDDNKVFKQLIKQSSRLALMGALPIILVLALAPETLLGVFGDEFRVASFLLYILLVGQLVNSLTGLGGDALQMTGNHRVFSVIVFVFAVVNIVLNLLLIPTFGYHGAALASIISLSGWKLVCAFVVWRKYSVSVIYLPLISK